MSNNNIIFLDSQLEDAISTTNIPTKSEYLKSENELELQIKLTRENFPKPDLDSDLRDELLELLKEVAVPSSESTFSKSFYKSDEHIDTSLEKETAHEVFKMLQDESFDDVTDSEETER